MSLPMTVLSPPGIISPSRPSSSRGTRTSLPVTPIASSACRCSENAPCRANTPTRESCDTSGRSPRAQPPRVLLPPTVLDQPILPNLPNLHSDHGFFQPLRHISLIHISEPTRP